MILGWMRSQPTPPHLDHGSKTLSHRPAVRYTQDIRHIKPFRKSVHRYQHLQLRIRLTKLIKQSFALSVRRPLSERGSPDTCIVELTRYRFAMIDRRTEA